MKPQFVSEEEKEARRERAAQAREMHAYQDLCDSIIVDVEVYGSRPDKGVVVNIPAQNEPQVQVKFLAIAGGCGPAFTMPRSLAEALHKKLGEYLGLYPASIRWRNCHEKRKSERT